MSLTASLAIYVIIWWVTLFTILPFWVTPHEEESDHHAGTKGSAPENPMIGRKMLITTGVSLIIFLIFYWLVVFSGISLDDIPFAPKFDSYS